MFRIRYKKEDAGMVWYVLDFRWVSVSKGYQIGMVTCDPNNATQYKEADARAIVKNHGPRKLMIEEVK